MSVEVHVKQEPTWDSDGDSRGPCETAQADPLADTEIKSEHASSPEVQQPPRLLLPDHETARERLRRLRGHCDHTYAEVGAPPVEAVWVKEERECGASAGACAGLYADHVVKDELVLGPERLQPRDGGLITLEQPSCFIGDTHTREPGPAGHARASAVRDSDSRRSASSDTAGTNTYVCDTCGYLSRRKHYLIDHLKVHAQDTVEVSRVKPTSDLQEHLRMRKRPFSYDICDKKFTISGNLNQHKFVHTGQEPYSCDICKKQFRLKGNLKTHILIHTRQKPYSCEICKKEFRLKGYLSQHKSIHTGDKPHSCEVCDKKFTHLSILIRHKLIHTGHKAYSCDICKKQFRIKGYLNIHKRTHTGDKPHSCEVCDKRFTTLRSLNQHKLIHTGQKPYSCEICKKEFRQKSNLNQHKSIHAGHKSRTPVKCV